MAVDRTVSLGGEVARIISPQDATEAMRMAVTGFTGLMVLEQEAERGNHEAQAWLRVHRRTLRRLLGIA